MTISTPILSDPPPAGIANRPQGSREIFPGVSIIDSLSLSEAKKAPRLIAGPAEIFGSAPVQDKKESTPLRDIFITLAGCPGAGKSTHGQLLSKQYGIPHISVGKILRKEVTDNTPLGQLVKPFVEKGDLAPAHLVSAVVKNRLSQPDCRHGFILDGFPRKMEDVEALEGIQESLGLKGIRMVCIEVNPEEVIGRVQNRRVCDNGHQYDLVQSPPVNESICDIDRLPLKQRDDDKPETIRHRFQIFKDETMPVIDYFKKSGEYTEVSGSGSIEDVQKRLSGLFDPEDNPTQD